MHTNTEIYSSLSNTETYCTATYNYWEAKSCWQIDLDVAHLMSTTNSVRLMSTTDYWTNGGVLNLDDSRDEDYDDGEDFEWFWLTHDDERVCTNLKNYQSTIIFYMKPPEKNFPSSYRYQGAFSQS